MPERKKVTLPALFAKVAEGTPITWLTCYDYPTAHLQEQAGIDMILVGDSLGMTMLGFDSTLPVTMEDMIRHAAAVRRGCAHRLGRRRHALHELPALRRVRDPQRRPLHGRGRLRRGQARGRRRDGRPGRRHRAGRASRSSATWASRPRASSALGGFRLQGKGAAQARKIVDDAKALEDAGAFCILLELVPDRVCRLITERAEHCIIMSLGSGPDAHGQLLIYHDAFALYPKFTPRMAKVFADAGAVIREGLAAYVAEVTGRTFPQPENWFGMKDDEYDELVRLLR